LGQKWPDVSGFVFKLLPSLDVRSYRKADSDTYPSMMVAKFRERLLVIERATQKFDMQRFVLKRVNDAEVR
jgi:hypothetical protein